MPDAFNDLAKVTRSHIPSVNAPARIYVPHVRPQPAWEGWTVPEGGEAVPSTQQDETCRPSENREISVHYAVLDEVWNRNEIIVDGAFAYSVATDIMLSDDTEPRSVDECQRITNWSNWKQVIQVELDSLAKHKVFGPIVPTPPHVKPVGYK
ncbi:hypothetical protein ACFX13_015279 [Malus domestica]